MTSFKPLWAVIILVVLAAMFMLSPFAQKDLMAADKAQDQAVVAMGEKAEQKASTATKAATSAAEGKVAKVVSENAIADAKLLSPEHVLAARSMGNPDAPVKMEEFASLSCPHCAHFHNDVFPKIKEAYIDTGKVYFTFTDFPLNAPALEGALIARCLPENRYFKFLGFLFEKQADWAFSGEYRNYLKQNARLLGLTGKDADQCLSDARLRGGIVEKMQKAGKEHEISSTPSFVLNNEERLKGAQNFENFSKAIDELLEK